MFIFPALWLVDVVRYMYVFSSPGLFSSCTVTTNSGVGSPMRIWSYWAAQSGPGSPSKGLLCFWHILPTASCPVRSHPGTLACLGGWRVTQYRLPRPHGNRAGGCFRFFVLMQFYSLFEFIYNCVCTWDTRNMIHICIWQFFFPFYFHIHHHRVVSRFPCTIRLDLFVQLIDKRINVMCIHSIHFIYSIKHA